MSDGLVIQYQDHEVRTRLKRLREQIGNLRPVMKQIGEYLVLVTRERWDKAQAPDGTPWKPNTPFTLQQKAAEGRIQKTLVSTGRLRDSITYKADSKTVLVGTNVQYAAIHQFGGSTAPRKIVPKNKKALYWPGAKHPVKSVNHPGFKIPRREFLGVSNFDKEEIIGIIEDYITK